MKVWALSKLTGMGYDEYEGHVIVAKDEESARAMANIIAAGEGEIWEDSNLSHCEEVCTSEQRIVLSSFYDGIR